MSFDVTLYEKIEQDELDKVYNANITHNLNKMAQKAEIYDALWKPKEIGITKAGELINLLEKGLIDLKSKPEYYKQFNNPI